MKDKPRYVEARKLADGGVQYVWNPPSALKASGQVKFTVLGTDRERAFMEAIALNTHLNKVRPGSRIMNHTAPDVTIEELCRQYFESTYFTSLRESTRLGYRTNLKNICSLIWNGRQVGDMMLKEIRPRVADSIYATLLAERGKASSAASIRVIKLVFNIAYKWEMIEANPWVAVTIPRLPPRQVLWTEDQVRTFITASEEIGRPSVGLIMLMTYHLGQRLYDMVQLTWDKVSADCSKIRYTQSKRGVDIFISCPPELQQALLALPHREGAVARPEASKGDPMAPWNFGTFSYLARKIIAHAGLPKHLWARDMRRTALTEMGEAGATEDELMAVSGHQSRASVAPYVVHRTRMADSAMAKRAAMKEADRA